VTLSSVISEGERIESAAYRPEGAEGSSDLVSTSCSDDGMDAADTGEGGAARAEEMAEETAELDIDAGGTLCVSLCAFGW
jgi:hypothetical protein